MAQYPSIYTDKSGRVITTMHNIFTETGTECLEVVIDGVHFTGSSFDSLELRSLEDYTDEQLRRFTFNKVPIVNSNAYSWELCNCRIDIHIPQTIVDVENEEDIEVELKLVMELGKPSINGGIDFLNARFNLSFGDENFNSESDGFEMGLAQIQKELWPSYRFKNCYSCHYSDYSPAGNGFFGDMMCFRSNKVAYLTASRKEDFFKLALEGYIPVQETYCCGQFAPREKGTGYRGWPFE
jgi:hypothetical protein